MTEKQLTQLGKKWQKILHLQDWDINFEFGLREISGDMANCESNKSLKIARVTIKDPFFYSSNYLRAQDIDLNLLHELVHLHLCYWKPTNDMEMTMEEQACESIARAILGAYNAND